MLTGARLVLLIKFLIGICAFADQVKLVQELTAEQKEVIATLQPHLPPLWTAKWNGSLLEITFTGKAYYLLEKKTVDKFSPESNASRAKRIRLQGEKFVPRIQLIGMPFLQRAQYHNALLRQKKIRTKIRSLEHELAREIAFRDKLTDYGRIPTAIAFRELSDKRVRKAGALELEIKHWSTQIQPVAEIRISHSDFRIIEDEKLKKPNIETHPYELPNMQTELVEILRGRFNKVLYP